MRIRARHFVRPTFVVAWRIATVVAVVFSVGFARAQSRANEGGDITVTAPPSERRPLVPSRDEVGATPARAEPPASPAQPTTPPAPTVTADAATAPSQPSTPKTPPSPVDGTASKDDDRLGKLARKLASQSPTDGGVASDASGATTLTTGQGKTSNVSLTAGDGAGSPPIRRAEQAAGSSQATPALASPNERLALGSRQSASNDGASEPALTSPGGGWISQTIGALAIVVLLIFAARAVLSRWTRRGSAGGRAVVEVLTRTPVAARSSVVLLRLGGRILVVADGPGGMRTLTELDEPEEVAELLAAVTASQSSSVTHSFRQLFDRFNKDAAPADDPVEHGADSEEIHVDRTRDRLSGLLAKMRALGGKEARA